MIKCFNNHFDQICKNLTSKKMTFVLGLSGGMDSMALLYLLKNFVKNNKNFEIQIFPIIIDHNLRLESNKEAHEVKKISKKLGFETNIKKIYDKIPSGNIQNWARKKRRDLLCEIANKLSANLILAHHFDDQAETLFMRLTKKSGLEGLQGMQSISVWNGISIIRPLLIFKKEELKSYVVNKNIIFFEDISNTMLKFERVKTRYLLDRIRVKWPFISEDLNKFSNINNKLIKKVNFFFNDWVKHNILIDKTGSARVNYENLKIIFEKSNVFTISIVGKIIQTIGGNEFPPKRIKTYNLIYSMIFKNLKNKTLGNVKIFLKNNYLFFIREHRNLSANMEIIKGKHYLFDGRFLIVSNESGNLILSFGSDLNIINNKSPFFKYKDIINKTIPYLQTLEGTNIKPYLNIIDANSDINKKLDNKPFSLYLINRVLV
tara:strand:+ start:237 stop:1532 length:1296 start_codon:yes stop_codon:yes gene_type:complete